MSDEWCWYFAPPVVLVSLIQWGWGSLASVLCPEMASSSVVADIPRIAASGTSLVRSWLGYINAPRFWADRLIELSRRPPQKLGGLALLLSLPHAPALACSPCGSVVGCRQWLCGTPQPPWWWLHGAPQAPWWQLCGIPLLFLWPQWLGPHLSMPWVLH